MKTHQTLFGSCLSVAIAVTSVSAQATTIHAPATMLGIGLLFVS